MDYRTALDSLWIVGYRSITSGSHFEFEGGERVRVMHLDAPKSGRWVISMGVMLRTEWVGGSVAYDKHIIRLDNGDEISSVVNTHVVYADNNTQMAYETSSYRILEEDECPGCAGIGQCFCADSSDYDTSDYYGAESDLYDSYLSY